MWEISLSEQIISFLYALLVGAVLSFIYDLFRADRMEHSRKVLIIFIQDIAFWLISAFITFMLLMARCNGEMRGYILVGELIGFVVYRLSVSRILFPCFIFIQKLLKRISAFYKGAVQGLAKLLRKILEKIAVMLRKSVKNLQFKRKNS